MSLILEALRKSEAERRRGQAPDLHAELPPTPATRRMIISPWILLVVASTMLLAGLWLVHIAREASVARAPTTAAGTTPPRDIAPAPSLPAVPKLSPPVVAAQPASVPTPKVSTPVETHVVPTAPSSDTSASAITPTASPPPIAIAPAPPTVPASTGANAILQLSDLSADERQSLPPLKISMHLWNDDPAQRFVIIDGNRLTQGDRIGDAVIRTIVADGVLLDWHGRQLKLPIR